GAPPSRLPPPKRHSGQNIRGRGVGADDYITKPFGIGELRARVAAHLRREMREKKQAVSVGGVQFLLKAKKVRYKDEELDFTKSEYAICEYLALNHGQVFSKERIYEHVFGYEKESDNSVITEHIKNIRAKCQKAGLEPIETVWGIGYRWR
ncbi:response regulator transcription factor, partial [Schaedlerella sp.]|uniref:response regulator transcription factor n=1 Tax=Schaedlerella sp. TaxID=2676057 RepID=UPI003747EEDB